jgi:hypothetical protein
VLTRTVRIGQHRRDKAPVDVGQPLGRRPRLAPQLARRAASSAVRVEAKVGALVEPAVELLLVVGIARERGPGSKLVSR